VRLVAKRTGIYGGSHVNNILQNETSIMTKKFRKESCIDE
jgi:hypothetical protein